VKPLLQVTQSVSQSFQKSFDKFREFGKVHEENEKLKSELAEVKKKFVNQTEFLKENERLRDLLGFQREVDSEAVPARVIARDLTYWSRWVVLDKGTKDGVFPGMILVSPQGLAGRVISVGKNIARAILIIDGESRVSVTIQTTRDTGLLEGKGDEPLSIKLLSLNSELKAGDAVVTSGLGGSYPKGIPVGSIQAISVDADGLHLNAIVKPFSDFNKLEEVLCLKPTVLN